MAFPFTWNGASKLVQVDAIQTLTNKNWSSTKQDLCVQRMTDVQSVANETWTDIDYDTNMGLQNGMEYIAPKIHCVSEGWYLCVASVYFAGIANLTVDCYFLTNGGLIYARNFWYKQNSSDHMEFDIVSVIHLYSTSDICVHVWQHNDAHAAVDFGIAGRSYFSVVKLF